MSAADPPRLRFRAAGGLTLRLPHPPEADDLAAQLRASIRSSEVLLVVVAALVGCASGAVVTGVSLMAQGLHVLLYGIAFDQRLSAMDRVKPATALAIPVAGGLLLGISEVVRRARHARVAVDPVEANALRGGRMSLGDSIVVTLQTLLSNGCGASVGLEAGYTQIGAGFASRVGLILRLRRKDLRILLGCGAAAAIAAAFGAPLTGAFYAFEIVLGAYSVANVAAVMSASLAAVLTSAALGGAPYALTVPPVAMVRPVHYLALLAVGVASSGLGIAVMRATALVERGFEASRLPLWARPALGGLVIGGLAIVTPQVLGAGHGAMKLDLLSNIPVKMLMLLIALKLLAAMTSLGAGFRGGLFFASLFVGCLLGKLFAAVIAFLGVGFGLDPTACVLTGMGAFAVAIVGGPLTMAFLVLETTGDFSVTAPVLAACVATSLTVRETFGYSFSTWRLHLRGETIRSAADIGWMRALTVGRLMRRDPPTLAASASVAEFRRRYPLGSTHVVVLLDAAERYAGIAFVADAFAAHVDAAAAQACVSTLARHVEVALMPEWNVKDALAVFDRAEGETLAVVESAASGHVVGLLTESFATRRYAEELDKANRGVVGEM